MSKIEIIFYKSEEIDMNVLDIYQIQIINLYNKAINMPRIRQMIYFICRDKGFMSCIRRKNGNFFVDLENYPQARYQDVLIFMTKRLLRAYHERKVIKLVPHGRWWDVKAEFDCSLLSHEERGILTKILKQENRRLASIGIKNRRQKRRYLKNIFLESFKNK